jgi:hypothetical protein
MDNARNIVGVMDILIVLMEKMNSFVSIKGVLSSQILMIYIE